MKNIVIIAAIVCAVSACKSSGTKKIDNTKIDNEAGVPNVNGNIPDTTNAIDLNTHKKDSSVINDTVK